MPRATQPRAENGCDGSEDSEWPPKISIGESPSALSKLAALIEEQDNVELWDFVADQVVDRLKETYERPKVARGASQRDLKPRARCGTSSPARRKQLRLAQALELPKQPGPVQYGSQQPAPALPMQWIIHPQGLSTLPSQPDPQRCEHQASSLARELHLKGVPWDWDFNSLTSVFKSIGICMHCDVGTVEWQGDGQVLVKLKSDEAAQKCLKLNSFTVQNDGPLRGEWNGIQAVQREDSSQAPSTNAAVGGSFLSGPYSNAYEIAESFLLDALGKSKPQGEERERPAAEPSGEKQIWADMSDGPPDAEGVLQALMK